MKLVFGWVKQDDGSKYFADIISTWNTKNILQQDKHSFDNNFFTSFTFRSTFSSAMILRHQLNHHLTLDECISIVVGSISVATVRPALVTFSSYFSNILHPKPFTKLMQKSLPFFESKFERNAGSADPRTQKWQPIFAHLSSFSIMLPPQK